MAKKTLIISDKEKYGDDKSMGGIIASSGKGKETSKPKHAPTIELTGPQVAAFGLDKATMGEKGCALVHYIVKSTSSGASYGDEVPGKKGSARVTLSITHVDPDCEGVEDDEDEEEEEGEGAGEGTGGTDEADSEDEAAEDDDSKPKRPSPDTASPSEALGDEG
jgi:hypothetical protein